MMESRQIRNPFPGLRPFETDEYRLFFGREGQSDELLMRLERARFLAVVGTSGSGKSSLIRAGLLPALRGGLLAGSGWRIALMRPGGDPIGNLAHELAQEDVLPEAGGGLPLDESEAVIDATLRGGSLGLVDVARQGILAEHEKLLVVVDQFEELFRFRAAREKTSTGDEASAFVKLLLAASGQRQLSIYVVLTMRSDFLGDCAQFQGLPEAINDGQYLIPRLTREERRFAVTGPVGVTRGKITEPLVNRLLNDVGDNPDQLPILQHALMRTWNHWAAHRRNGEPIGMEHYEAIGTMSEALSLHADEAFNELPDDRSRQIAETIFKALSERGSDNREIRRPTRLQALCEIAAASPREVIAVIDVFRGGGRSFLMPPAGVELQPQTVIDISHESLIRNWDRLKKWVDAEAQSARIYRRLAEAAVLHREGSEGLLQEPALQIALDWFKQANPNAAWAERYHPEFSASLAYLEESRAAREAAIAERERQHQLEVERDRRELEQAQLYAAEQARAAQRLRRFTFALILISLLALGAAGGAVYAYTMARSNQKRAEESERRTRELAGNLDVSQRNVEAAKLKVAEEHKLAQDAQALAELKEQRALAEEKKAADAKADAENATRTAKVAKDEATRASRGLMRATEYDQLNRDALADFQRGNTERAERIFNNLARMYVNDPGKLAWAKSHLGEIRRQLGKLNESITDLEEAQKIQHKAIFVDQVRSGDKVARFGDITLDAEYLDTITWLAHAHNDKGKYELAQPLYLEALGIRRKSGSDLSTNLENLARNYKSLGQLEEAVRHYEEALELRRKNPGSPELTAALQEMSEFALELDDGQEAIKLLEEALRNQQLALMPDDPKIADTFNQMARIYEGLELKKRAERLNLLAKEIRLSRRVRDDKVSSLGLLAYLYITDGKPRQAEKLLSLANEFYDARKDDQSQGMANQLIDYGDYLRGMAKLWPTNDTQNPYKSAEYWYQQALEISQKKGFVNEEVHSLDGLAQLRLDLGKLSDAEVLFQRTLRIREQKPGVDLRPELATIENLHGLTASTAGQGKNAEAEAYLVRALKVFDGMNDFARRSMMVTGYAEPDITRHATSAKLAELYRRQGRVKEADDQYKPLAGKLRAIPPEHLNTEYAAQNYLEIVENAGQFYTERGDLATAESFYRLVWPEGVAPTVKVLVNWPEEVYGKTVMALAPDSSVKQMMRILNSYAAMLKKAGREREADGISFGIQRLWARIEDGPPPESP